MTDIPTNPFDNQSLPNEVHHPLLFGCSGGRGHNSAIEAIRAWLASHETLVGKFVFDLHEPKLSAEYVPSTLSESFEKLEIEAGSLMMNGIPLISSLLKCFMADCSPFPTLPDQETLLKAVAELNRAQLDSEGRRIFRPYVDMMLDLIPDGHLKAALWNVEQRADNSKNLNKLVKLQSISDQQIYETVKQDLINKLLEACRRGTPYTEIISTQAMALPAMCDAVAYYNETIAHEWNAPPIKIHQYLTDLPTPSAVHFLKPLHSLTSKQRAQMKVYGVNFSEEVIKQFELDVPPFAGLFNIDPKNNPMVRPGFGDESLKNISFIQPITLKFDAPTGIENITIPSGAKIATIMLGSQASNDSVEYLEELLKLKAYDKIFVMGGTSPHIQALLKEKNVSLENAVLLGMQDSYCLAPLLVRSNLLVVRGGGLTVMELMALIHLVGQIILLHAKQDGRKLSSGICWEDGDADELIKYLKNLGVTIDRTTTSLISWYLNKLNMSPELSVSDQSFFFSSNIQALVKDTPPPILRMEK